ncbi:MAG TPA: hypothetical protein VEY92_10955 [Pseudoxanthomonas sp.]|nr:hypothetical protein [Pseudoxanthomonas sp.]
MALVVLGGVAGGRLWACGSKLPAGLWGWYSLSWRAASCLMCSKGELPENRDTAFVPFAGGAVGYALLLQFAQ